jgi:hypothetical protein
MILADRVLHRNIDHEMCRRRPGAGRDPQVNPNYLRASLPASAGMTVSLASICRWRSSVASVGSQ